MKKLIAVFILFSLAFSGTETFALSGKEAAKLDLTTPSGLSAEELSKGLRGELFALAEEFVFAEEKYGVNALFLAAVSALESGWGNIVSGKTIFSVGAERILKQKRNVSILLHQESQNIIFPKRENIITEKPFPASTFFITETIFGKTKFAG